MSKCIIKTNFHNALNLISLQTDENFINEDEVIIEVKYEISEQNKSIYHILALLSKGTIIFIEYNTVIRKTIKMTGTHRATCVRHEGSIPWVELK